MDSLAPAPRHEMLTPFDRDLLSAIQAAADIDGAVSSLFRVAVRDNGLHYEWARQRLRRLEVLGYVSVQRRTGLPLVIQLTDRLT